jgi:tetratricopeptide (TPR) repeat protein
MPQGGRRYRLLTAAVAGCCLVALVAMGMVWLRNRGPELPDLPLAGKDPAIVRAVERARTAVVQAPRSGAAWGQLGMVLAAHDFTAEADICFAGAEALDPQEPRWPYYQAVDLSRGEPDAAIVKLQRAVELCGSIPDAVRLRLGEMLLKQGRVDEAEDHFRRLVAQDSNHPRAHLGLGRVAHERGRLEESLGELQVALADPRTRQAAHILLAQIHQQRGAAKAAQEEQRRAAELPKDPIWLDPFVEEVARLRTGRQAALEHADRLLRDGQISEAIALLQQTIHDYPESDWAWFLLGKAYVSRRDWKTAERTLRRAAERAPASAEIHFNLGIALYGLKDWHKAAAHFRKAVELKPDYALAHYDLALCFLEEGKQAAALESVHTALRAQPSLVEAHTLLSELLIRRGEIADALQHIQSALTLSPGNQKALRLMASSLGLLIVPVGL